MTIYNKLVRDRIPEILDKKGLISTTRILEADEYMKALHAKLEEEAGEFLNAEPGMAAVEELADLLEVAYALAEANGVSAVELERIRAEKAKMRGAFEKRIYLIEVEDNES